MSSDIPNMIEAIDHAMTALELSAILSISKSSLYAQVKRNSIPYFYLPGTSIIRFDPKRIADWLRNGTSSKK
jgi:predicted DNA-binding transcriptional regulator AlpA